MNNTHYAVLLIYSLSLTLISFQSQKDNSGFPRPVRFVRSTVRHHQERTERKLDAVQHVASGKMIRKRSLHEFIPGLEGNAETAITAPKKFQERPPKSTQSLKDGEIFGEQKGIESREVEKENRAENEKDAEPEAFQEHQHKAPPHKTPSDEGSGEYQHNTSHHDVSSSDKGIGWVRSLGRHAAGHLRKFWNWILRFFRISKAEKTRKPRKVFPKKPARIFHVLPLEESPFGQIPNDVTEKSQLNGLDLLKENVATLKQTDDPERLAEGQLQLLQQRGTLEGLTPAELDSLVKVASDQISDLSASIPLKEAEWQLLKHVIIFCENTPLPKLLYERYQMDAEFRRGVTFASDTVFLRNLRHLELEPVTRLSSQILGILKDSNWGVKRVDDNRIIAAEELFMEVIKDNRINTSGRVSLLHIPTVLENISPRSHSDMRKIINQDKKFMSIIAIVSNQVHPGVPAENLPKSTWTYRVLKDHDEAVKSFDDFVQREYAGTSTWPNSPPELKETKDTFGRLELINLFKKSGFAGSPFHEELIALSSQFMDSSDGKPWIEQKKVEHLTERCLILLSRPRIDQETKTWLHAALKHLGTYGFPTVVNRINNPVQSKNSDDVACYWYMDSKISAAGNDEELFEVRRVASLLQRLTTETQWDDILAEKMTFRKTMEEVLTGIQNDRLSMTKARLQLYDILAFVLNRFKVSNDWDFMKKMKEDRFLMNCMGGLWHLSKTNILDFEFGKRITGFGFGLKKDLTLDEPYLDLMRARGQLDETRGILYGGLKEEETQSLITELRNLKGEGGLPKTLMSNLASRLEDLRDLPNWDTHDKHPVNSFSMTEAMLFHAQNMALEPKERQYISRVLELLMKHDEVSRKMVLEEIGINPGLQDTLDLLHFQHVYHKIFKEGIIRGNIRDIELTIIKDLGQFKNIDHNWKILERIMLEISQGVRGRAEQRMLSAFILYLSEKVPGWEQKFFEEMDKKIASQISNVSDFNFQHNVLKDSLDLRSIAARTTQTRGLGRNPLVGTTSNVFRDYHSQLSIKIDEIKKELSIHDGHESIDLFSSIIRNGIHSNQWDPPNDYYKKGSLYWLVTNSLIESRAERSSFGERLVYSLIFNYIEDLPGFQEAKEIKSSAIASDEKLAQRLVSPHAFLKMREMRLDNNIPGSLGHEFARIANMKPHEWDNSGSLEPSPAQLAIQNIGQLMKNDIQEDSEIRLAFGFSKLLSEMSVNFRDQFVKFVREDEQLADKIGKFMARIYSVLGQETIQDGSLLWHLLEDNQSGPNILRQYILSKTDLYARADGTEHNDLYKKLSELPREWTSSSNVAGRLLLEEALEILRKSRGQSVIEGKSEEVPKDAMLAFYVVHYLTKYNRDLKIEDKSTALSRSILGSSLHEILPAIYADRKSLICGSDFFEKHPQFVSSPVPLKSRVIEVLRPAWNIIRSNTLHVSILCFWLHVG